MQPTEIEAAGGVRLPDEWARWLGLPADRIVYSLNYFFISLPREGEG